MLVVPRRRVAQLRRPLGVLPLWADPQQIGEQLR
jgi:hypothetical protein